MMRRLITILAVTSVIGMMSAVPAAADAPVVGSQDCWFNLGWAGPSDPTWVCVETFDGVEYGAAAFAIGSGKPFDATPAGPAIFFEELVEIYETLEFEFVDGVLTTFDPGPVILSGIDRGLVNAASNSYHGNGTVLEASGPFDGLEGRRYQASGPIEWYPFGAPFRSLDGKFRIN